MTGQDRLYTYPLVTLAQLHAGIIHQGSFADCHELSAVYLYHLRTVSYTFQRTQFRFRISALCHTGHPGIAIAAEEELRIFGSQRTIPEIKLIEGITESQPFIIQADEQGHFFLVLIGAQ